MSAGVWVLVIAVPLALAFGLWRALTDGRLRGTHRVHGLDTTGSAGHSTNNAGADSAGRVAPPARIETPWADHLGERATLVQFSSAFCAPCRTTKHVLAAVADTTPGVTHIEIDAEHHLDLVRELGIMRTPTTLILGPDGAERFRASGVPKRDQVIAAIS